MIDYLVRLMLIFLWENFHASHTYSHSLLCVVGVSAIKSWSLTSGHLEDDDLLISADVDEVLSQDALHHLRLCRLAAPVISGALIMPFGNLNMAYRQAF